jgi:cyclopropane fatty-acyl-phospholipid synthase-like methyltransferase
VDTSGIEAEFSGDVVADSVATYSEDPDAFAAFGASAVAGPFAAFEALLQPSSTVLDAGCGAGRDLARLAECGHRGLGSI